MIKYASTHKMDKELVEDILKVLERLDADEEVESIKERLQASLPPPKDYLRDAIADAKKGLHVEKYKDLLDNDIVWRRVASAAVKAGHRDVAKWVFDNKRGSRESCLVEAATALDKENFTWMSNQDEKGSVHMHDVFVKLALGKDDVAPIKFMFEQCGSQMVRYLGSMGHFAGLALLQGHTEVALFFRKAYPEWVKLTDMVDTCLRHYQITCLLRLWSEYPETKEMTQKQIVSVMNFNTFGSEKWIAVVNFLKQSKFDISTLKSTFTATHHYHTKTLERVMYLLE